MLNIGKLAAGSEGYYLSTVASGVEDYYTGAGEAPGYWLGEASGDVDLDGRVDDDALRAVLGGCHPHTQRRLPRDPQRRLPGYDLTFRAPKSVSLLWGLADEATAAEVREAHDAAVAAAIGYLERNAAGSRRGHGGAEQVAVSGFIAAAFRHRTSRAGDPLLHTHVLVANVARAVDDGRWRTLDGRRLYVHAKTAGYLYQAHLRHELTRRLGVDWQPVVNGCADLAGVPREVIEAFSQRRVEILDAMAERGESSAQAAQTATLATRKAKQYGVDATRLRDEWTARAAEVGLEADTVAALVDRDRAPRPADVAGAFEQLAGPRGLTAQASTFTRRDVVQAWCAVLSDGADVADLEALADAFLAEPDAAVALDHAQALAHQLTSRDIIRRQDGRVVMAGEGARFSTPELLALEQRVITGAQTRRQAGTAVATPVALGAALRSRPTLTDEQTRMVRRLVTEGAGVDVVIGKAGAGKTFALDAARHAWEASGVRVLGCALAARAAAELQDGAGIPSSTIDALLGDLDRPGPHGGLAAGSVLVVDEAGMVGTRKLARLTDHASRAGAKLVLVGDDHQLPEIDAGGVLRGLAHRLPVIELQDNRRQHAAWEREALDELRDGDVAAAVGAYDERGRVVTADTAEAVREQLVSDWWTHRLERPDESGVMVALRASDVEDLNSRARVRLTANGDLRGPELEAGDCGFRAGDQVVCTHNDRALGVINGTTGMLVEVDIEHRTVVLRRDDGERVALPPAYLDAGHLAHRYAITAHKAQGATVDRAWVLGSNAAYREWGYVALSRARAGTHLYAITPAFVDPDEAHSPPNPMRSSAVESTVAQLSRSRAQALAVDQRTDRLAERHARLRHERAHAIEALERVEVQLADAAPPRRRLFARKSPPHTADVTRLQASADAWCRRIAALDEQIADAERKGAAVHRPDGPPAPVLALTGRRVMPRTTERAVPDIAL